MSVPLTLSLAAVVLTPLTALNSEVADVPQTWIEVGEPYCSEVTMMSLPVAGPHLLEPDPDGFEVYPANEQFWTAQVVYSFERSGCPNVLLEHFYSGAETPWQLQPMQSGGTSGFLIRAAKQGAKNSWVTLSTADGAKLLSWFVDPQQ